MTHDPGFTDHTIRHYADSPDMQKKLYKRSLLIIVLSQIFGGAGLASGVTVGALLAQEMLGKESFAGVPTALFTLGSAAAALLVGRFSERYGRRLGLSTGFFAGGLGALGVIWAAVTNNVALLFLSLLIYGAGSATNMQARYAGTDLAMPNQRAKAVSIAMVSTTLGAVAGPAMVDMTGDFAVSVGVPALGGPFILAAAAYTLAGLVFFIFLRPDPYIVAKAISAAQQSRDRRTDEERTTVHTSSNRGLVIGATVMILTQIVMIAIMTMTPVHMKHHGHSLGDVGLVIGVHIGSMYLPSLLTGALVDKIGREAMSIASGGVLLLAGVVAAAAPPDSLAVLLIALSLLGIGWNFGLISGTAIIVDSTDPATRAKTQGTIDVLIALSGASGGALSGMVVAHSSYATLSLAGGGLALLLIPVLIWSRRTSRAAAPAQDKQLES
ncbi:Predicted arabinose efflux permease, MFS family [Paenibacillus sp. UNCCL117]|uniref:MFS transporter n=1 Tax=unclassified Paenibacillus TaxID=185978 RepID=UPI0008894A1C|nr:MULTISPECIES: MFS transporter [unclassified Paenibacillus]SDE15123.1 Predicted arabinose efflux permease, MFS family [Paenibacillus sp. cl123]SFW60808.1 Predicted arabinose efflux permease, MFS family [Paenibacillus sp. UNCCL117]